MIITDLKKTLTLEQGGAQPYLPMLSFDIHTVCHDVAQSFFPALRLPINLRFCKNNTLACICSTQDRADIFVHVLLNDGSTPIQVLRHIVAHELLHLVVPSAAIDGRQVMHTDESWRYEARVAPDRSRSWAWIMLNLHSCILMDKKNERTLVKRNWKRLWGTPRCSWELCNSIVEGSLY